jgi:hypothetical protein
MYVVISETVISAIPPPQLKLRPVSATPQTISTATKTTRQPAANTLNNAWTPRRCGIWIKFYIVNINWWWHILLLGKVCSMYMIPHLDGIYRLLFRRKKP